MPCCVRRSSDMTANGWFQILLFFALIFLVTKPIGIFMARVFNREKSFVDPVLRPVERLLYRVTAVDENHEMRWTDFFFQAEDGIRDLYVTGVQTCALPIS